MTVRLAALVCLALMAPRGVLAQQPAELRWGGDAEGGAPYVEADPADLTRVVGFDVEIAQLLAAGLGRAARFVQVGFTSIDAAAARGDFDIGLSGIEDSAARRSRLAVTIPYYEFREVLTVRSTDAQTYRSLADLRGRRVATLGATLAYDLLVEAQARDGIVPVTYEDDVHPYSDLVLGRVDAVVLDAILAQRGVRRNAGLTNQSAPLAIGHYVGILAPESTAMRDRMNVALRDAMRDGRLEAIFKRWDVWNEDQPRLYARVLADQSQYPVAASSLSPSSGAAGSSSAPRTRDAARRYLPALLRAAVITIVLSCLSMALAIAAGALIASGRIYGAAPLRIALTGYVEIIRGTPLLLQLFVLYFGLAAFIQLPAFVAALLGLGLNYAAYESEIYRGALEAVPAGQLESARTLGFTERQILVLVRAPQAFRLALAPMTNDFVALLKDSSLVSVITVVELTKETSIFAANIGSWVLPGLMCAAIYLAMSLPLARVARRIERGWRHAGPVLDVRSLEVRRGGRTIVAGVSFAASPGEIVVLMGASGAGKSTILRAIAGLDPIVSGTVAIPRPVGMVFQFHHLFANMTAYRNVWLAPVHVFGRPRAEAERRARELLVSLGVGDRASAMPHELSGGEAQRVAIARALAIEPPVLLMDEPTASLDPARRGDLAATLRRLAAGGRTIVVATHDAEFARACAHRVLSVEEGRVRDVS